MGPRLRLKKFLRLEILLRTLTALAAVCMLVGAISKVARAQTMIDRLQRRNGIDSGQITSVTPLGVTISKNGVDSTVAVEDIESVYLAGEPDDLNSARVALQAGRTLDAKRILDGISTDGIRRDEVVAEVEFFKAQVKALLALAGQGELAAATTEVRGFMTRRRNSFHVPQAIELAGDLLVASGQYGDARTEYAKLAKAKSAYFELRSALLVGRAWQAEGKNAEALAEFDKVLANTDRGPLIEPLKLSATLDRAVSQAAGGGGDEAAKGIGAIIAKTDPEDATQLARAYNALGDCYLKAGDKQGALFAFLHVDLLYGNAADAHAKALHELVGLWHESGHDNRSQEAAQKLAEKYPGSRWAKK
jgi:tetratricopeptide (TPR) repeat protein